MKKNILTVSCAFLLLFQGSHIEARQPYHATVAVDAESATVSAPNLLDLTRDLRETTLELLLPLYTPTSPLAIGINLRGIDTIASFAANSTSLVVTIPQAGTTEVFAGATRDESLRLFKEFIRDGGRKHKLLKAYAKYSPIDPIAGNPNSLLAQMAEADYLVGALSPLQGCSCCWSAQPIVHQFQVGTYVERAFSRGFDTTSVTLPLRYSYSPDLNWAFVIDAPLTYNRNGGASSLFSSLGLGLRVPLTFDWSLTPLFRFGAGGSLDLCTAGSFVSTGITSVYNYPIDDYVITLTNYVGYITSTNLWLSGINFNYRLHEYVFKNGLSVTTCEGITFCNRPFNLKLAFEDTYFTGHRLYIKHYDEISLSIITFCINPYLDYDCASLGFGYQFGDKRFRGFQLNLAYQF